MTAPLPHRVDDRPFDPQEGDRLSPELERYYMSSQWRMVWLKLRRHRVAVVSGVLLAALYLMTIFAEFLSPYAPNTRHVDHIYAPPQSVQFFNQGRFIGPFVLGYDQTLDMDTLKRVYVPNPAKVHRLRFLCEATRTISGASSRPRPTWSARPRAAISSGSAPTASGATC